MTTVASTEKFSYSLDGELYEGDYSSFAEAVEAAKEAARDEQNRNGEPQEAWVGRLELTPLTDYIDGEDILSAISGRVYEDLGDCYEDFLEELLTPRAGQLPELNRVAAIGELEQVVSDWITSYVSAGLWRMADYKRINLKDPEVVA